MKGCFIVFEGIDGAGKGVQVTELAKKLRKDRYQLTTTREPTSNRPIGKLILKILYNSETVSDEALALLFAADRADHTKNKIVPARNRGAIVISDRYVYSSYAYQTKGMNTEIDLEWIKTINKCIIKPDIVIFLDIPPEEGLNRLQKGQKRIQDDSYFEDLLKQEQIRSMYYKILNLKSMDKHQGERKEKTKRVNEEKIKVSKVNGTIVLRIDGMLPAKDIHKIIYKYVKKFLVINKTPKLVKKKILSQGLSHFIKIDEKTSYKTTKEKLTT